MKPLWKRSDVRIDKQYVLLLLEDAQGARYYDISENGSVDDILNENEECVFVTGPVPYELIARGDLIGISEKVSLSDGSPFFVDAHCIWFTKDEMEDIDQDRVPVRWVRGRPPILPPK